MTVMLRGVAVYVDIRFASLRIFLQRSDRSLQMLRADIREKSYRCERHDATTKQGAFVSGRGVNSKENVKPQGAGPSTDLYVPNRSSKARRRGATERRRAR